MARFTPTWTQVCVTSTDRTVFGFLPGYRDNKNPEKKHTIYRLYGLQATKGQALECATTYIEKYSNDLADCADNPIEIDFGE